MNDAFVAPFLLERRLDISPEQARSSTKDSEEGIQDQIVGGRRKGLEGFADHL